MSLCMENDEEFSAEIDQNNQLKIKVHHSEENKSAKKFHLQSFHFLSTCTAYILIQLLNRRLSISLLDVSINDHASVRSHSQ